MICSSVWRFRVIGLPLGAHDSTVELLSQWCSFRGEGQQDAVNNGDEATYYTIVAQYGHEYGNLAYQAATDTGFLGIYANNFLEHKLSEAGQAWTPQLRETVMRQFCCGSYRPEAGPTSSPGQVTPTTAPHPDPLIHPLH